MSEREEFTGVIVPRFWDELRHLPLEVRALAAHLVTGRHNAGVPGCAAVSMATLADDLDVSQEHLAGLWAKLPPGFAYYDRRHRVLRVPRVPRIGHRPNHNVIRGWWRRWKALPESPLKFAHIESIREALPSEASEVMTRAWAETFGSVDLDAVETGIATHEGTGEPTHGPTGAATGSGYGYGYGNGLSSLVPDPDPEATKTVGSSTPRARARRPQPTLFAQPEPAAIGAGPDRAAALQQVAAAWYARFEERTGHKPTWPKEEKGKIFGSLKRLIGAVGADEVCRRIGILFDAPPRFLADSTPDVATLVQHFDKLAAPAAAARPRMLTTRSGAAGISPDDLAAEAQREMAEERERGIR